MGEALGDNPVGLVDGLLLGIPLKIETGAAAGVKVGAFCGDAVGLDN